MKLLPSLLVLIADEHNNLVIGIKSVIQRLEAIDMYVSEEQQVKGVT